jgi:hypothetical protein
MSSKAAGYILKLNFKKSFVLYGIFIFGYPHLPIAFRMLKMGPKYLYNNSSNIL